MPTIKRLCPGCRRALVLQGRCPACATLHAQQRGGSTRRGYDRQWRKRRLTVLQRDPLCTLCLAQGRIRPSTEADHIVPKHRGGTDEFSNLRGVCKRCNAGRR